MRTTTPRFRIITLIVALGFVAAAVGLGVAMSGTAAGKPTHGVGSSDLIRATAPSAPRAPTAVPANGRATVHWTAPASVNGSPISAYIVWPYLGRAQQKPHEFHSKATTQVVTGLELDIFYRITEGLDVPVRIELRNFKWPAKVQA